MLIDYGNTEHPVRADFAEGHNRYWKRLAKPGYWFTGAQRVDMAREVRNAPHCALCQARKTALSPTAVTGSHDTVSDLPDVVVEVIHRVITDPKRLTKTWFDGVLSQGLTPEAYIEVVGTTVHVFMIDEFCRALGEPVNTLPKPLVGAPSGYRPAGTIDVDAWVEVLPNDIEPGRPEFDLAGKLQFNVFRGLSLAPDEVRTVLDLIAIHYLPGEEIGDFRSGFGGALDRYQKEVVATRISSFNSCYYCTSGHSAMLSVSYYLKQSELIEMTGLTDPDCTELEGVSHSRELIAFCDAFMGEDPDELSSARQAVVERMGPQALVDVAGVASNFQRMNRIADSTGIPIDPAKNDKEELRRHQMNERLGINSYGSAANSLKGLVRET